MKLHEKNMRQEIAMTEKRKPILIFDVDETLIDKNDEIYPMVYELLRELFNLNYRLWIVSFKQKIHTVKSLRESRILELFETISYGYHNGGKSLMIKNLCEQYNVNMADCILFDDNMSNILNLEGTLIRWQLVNKTTGVTKNDIDEAIFKYESCDRKREKRGKVYVGTKNEVKISAVQAVFFDYDIIGVNVDSLVSSQPIGFKETSLGAYNRMNQIINKYPDGDFWIGIENGLVLFDENENQWFDVPIVSLCSKQNLNKTIKITGASIPVSFKGYNDISRYQQEISSVNNRACEYFTSGAVTRNEIIQQAIKIARYSTNN